MKVRPFPGGGGSRDFFFMICVLGLVSGSVFGVLSADIAFSRSVLLPGIFDRPMQEGFGFLKRLAVSSVPFAAAFVFGTSVIGQLIIPLLCFFRGFCFSYCVSSFFSDGNSLFSAFSPFGVTAFILIPAFVVFSCEACCFASRLRLLMKNSVARSEVIVTGKGFLNTFVFCIAALLLACILSMLAVPAA